MSKPNLNEHEYRKASADAASPNIAPENSDRTKALQSVSLLVRLQASRRRQEPGKKLSAATIEMLDTPAVEKFGPKGHRYSLNTHKPMEEMPFTMDIERPGLSEKRVTARVERIKGQPGTPFDSSMNKIEQKYALLIPKYERAATTVKPEDGGDFTPTDVTPYRPRTKIKGKQPEPVQKSKQHKPKETSKKTPKAIRFDAKRNHPDSDTLVLAIHAYVTERKEFPTLRSGYDHLPAFTPGWHNIIAFLATKKRTLEEFYAGNQKILKALLEQGLQVKAILPEKSKKALSILRGEITKRKKPVSRNDQESAQEPVTFKKTVSDKPKNVKRLAAMEANDILKASVQHLLAGEDQDIRRLTINGYGLSSIDRLFRKDDVHNLTRMFGAFAAKDIKTTIDFALAAGVVERRGQKIVASPKSELLELAAKLKLEL